MSVPEAIESRQSSEASASVSSSSTLHNEIDLFAGWFVDRLEKFDNAIYWGTSIHLDLNLYTGQRPPLPLNQEAPSVVSSHLGASKAHEGIDSRLGGMIHGTTGPSSRIY
ncbi:hypothetical protein J1N35_001755 [Gossypium stocksii]|uniref:Uncharacterized protein n=1 Tax=Gossypium stocksii TaxID=47602 RepID=A0A9D3WIC7_9ROSI|nr:hypothetical protein J1N35_001755 [Gossypium stocksii]